MTETLRQATTSQSLLYASMATMEVLEQVAALQVAIRDAVGDERARDSVKLVQIEKLAAIAEHLLTGSADAMHEELKAVTGQKTIDKE